MRCLLPSVVDDVGYDDLVGLYEFPAEALATRPWVRAIFVATVDGAAQGADERSGSLSSAADRQVFALQRSLSDAIVVGASTARIEGYRPVLPSEVDVELRDRLGLQPVPTIAVVSRSLAIDPALLADSLAPTVVITSAAAPSAPLRQLQSAGRAIICGADDIDLPAALKALAHRGYRRLMCEGGPTLFGSMVAADSIDELCLTIDASLVGGQRRRILNADNLIPTRQLSLRHLLEESDQLFARYLVARV